MSSLTSCLKKAGDAIRAEDKAAVLSKSREYRANDMTANNAGKKAIAEQLDAVRALIKAEQEIAVPKAAEQDQAPALVAPTRDEVVAKQEREEQAKKAEADKRRSDEEQARKEEDRKRIAQASQAAADTFVLGGNAMDNLTGQKDIFGAMEDAAPVAEAKPASKTPAKIEDSGEVLEGARKLYAKSYAAKLEEGKGMDLAAVPLAKSWPEPDYQRLIDEGADPWAVALARAVRDEVPTKPMKGWKLKGWVEKVEGLRNMADRVMSGDITKERFMAEGGRLNLADWFNKIDLYVAVGHANSLKTLRFSEGKYGMYGGQLFKPAKKLWTVNAPSTSASATWSKGNWGNDLVVADTKDEAIEKFKAWTAEQEGKAQDKPTGKRTGFDVYRYRNKPGVFIVGKRISATKSIDLMEFGTSKEANAFIVANQDRLEEMLAEAKTEQSERREENAPRVGDDHRNGADVTTEQFRETFGFRGEQFGASMPQAERQANMNQAYDALMDLAGVIGVAPKALSLNGELGLAFGARGTGGKNPVAAHYERDTTGQVTPNRVVINLTRKNGAGSLAHEWFHAVDNYFARVRGEKAGMLTESYPAKREGVRPEMVDAFKKVMMAIQSTGVRERSKNLDKKRTKDYWSTGLEMAARSFESYVIAKLQDKSGANDYLANILPESAWLREGSYPYPTMGELPAIRTAFDNFFATVQTKETDKGVAMFARGAQTSPQFYSQLKRAIEQVPERLATMPAQQWKLWLDSNGPKLGVKKDEIEWSGIKDYLDLRGKDKVSKADLAAYLAEGGVKVEETVLGGEDQQAKRDRLERERDAAAAKVFTGKPLDVNGIEYADDEIGYMLLDGSLELTDLPANKREAAAQWVSAHQELQSLKPEKKRNPKYAQYTLPGGQNYREVLLTLPPKKPQPKQYTYAEAEDQITNFQNPVEVRDGDGKFVKNITSAWGLNDNRKMIDSGEYRLFQYVYPDEKGQYKSSHWDAPNVLAHIRVNDRTDSTGARVLFVEELQSDWGQEGEKKGFGNGIPTAQEVEQEIIAMKADGFVADRDVLDPSKPSADPENQVFRVYHGPTRYTSWQQGRKAKTERLAFERVAMERLKARLRDRVPVAPFVTKTESWLNLALKRVMMMAVEGGYDKVAFTDAEPHFKRWGTERIDWAKQPDGSYLVRAKSQEGGDAAGIDLEAEALARGMSKTNSKIVWTVEELEKTIEPALTEGQNAADLAPKIWSRMQSEDVGTAMPRREGFEAFYGDKNGMNPKTGQPSFLLLSMNALLKKLGGGKVESVTFGNGGLTYDQIQEMLDDFEKYPAGSKARADLRAMQEAADDDREQLAGEQPGITITDAMRETVGQGLPLFARDRLAEASTPPANRLQMPVSDVQKAIDEMAAKWTNGLKTVVVNMPSDLPRPAPSDARGLLYGDTAYIVASNHANRAGVQRTLAHEAIGHYGLWKMLGPDGTRKFQKNLQLALKSGNKPLNELSQKVRKLYVDKNGKFNLSPEDEANEIAAFAVEAALDADGNFKPGFGFMKEVYAKIAQFLRDLGINIQFTNSELQGMLVAATRGMEAGKRLDGGGQVVVAAARNAGVDAMASESDSIYARGKFKGWPKSSNWTRQEYNDVVSLLPSAYRNDPHRREPLPANYRDSLPAGALQELASYGSIFSLDDLGNIQVDGQTAIKENYANAKAMADKYGLGVFATNVKRAAMQQLHDDGFVGEMGMAMVLMRETGSSRAPMATPSENRYTKDAYSFGTMMAYKPRGFSPPTMFVRGADGTQTEAPAFIDVDGKQRPTTNNLGQAIHPTEDGIRNFWRGFGDSKVVNEGGKPLVVYHGTNKSFNVFRPSKKFGNAYFASASTSYANTLAKDVFGKTGGDNVMPLYVSLQNPRIIDFEDYNYAALESAMTDGNADGLIAVDKDGVMQVVVAFEPTQIKSATGNNGDFSPSNPNIAFARGGDQSIGDAIQAITVTNLKTKAGNKLADYRNLGLQFLGGRQINDLYAKDLPQLPDYTRMVQQMSADANEVGANADAVATSWGKLKDERQLAELMHDATLAQIDPAKNYVIGDSYLQWEKLKNQYEKLSEEAKKVYADARDGYEEHYAQIREAIRDKIERSDMAKPAKTEMLKRMDGEFFEKIKGVYFPLARFGKYVVVTRKGVNVVSVSRAETLNEAEALRASMRKQFPADRGYSVGKVTKDKEFNAARDSVGRGFLKDLFDVLDNEGIGDQLQDAVNQLYLASMPDLSWAKHGIHRKGTPGFSQDARRAYAQNMFHGARYLAKLRYADQLQAKLTDMQDHVDAQIDNEEFDSVKAQQVVDELTKRNDSLMNPKSNPLSTALTSFGFVFHLGLSPASAMVNLSQTALVAYPIMGAKWGFDKAAAALTVASAQATANKNNISSALNPDERRAYDEAVRSGTIDVTNAHDLAGIAQGEDQGVMWKTRPVMKWASFMFHHAERFNRQVTFVASYRLARAAGATHEAAFEQATKATYDGHFDYAASNRPRIMQGNAAKVILLFKQFAQNMIYTLARQAQLSVKAETPAGKKEARRALGGILVLHALAAGSLGLPVVDTLLTVASMLGSDDDEPWDAETALRNMLADTFGQKPAEVMARGLSRLTPFDISGRVSLNHLIFPDIQEGLEGQRLAESAMTAALGPVAGIGVNMFKGMQEISEGRIARGLESMMPVVLRNPMKAYRYETEGNIDKTGVVINEKVSTAGVWGQAFGFSPSEVRNAQEARSAIYQADSALNRRRSALMNQFAMASMAGDEDGKKEVRQDIDAFNAKNPDRKITPIQLVKSVRSRKQRIKDAENGVYLPKKRRDAMEAGRFGAEDNAVKP